MNNINRKSRVYEILNAINVLRIAAGLNPVKRSGTSKDAIMLEYNRAQRGEFRTN